MLPALLACLDAFAPRPPQTPLRRSLLLLAPWFCLALLATLCTASLQSTHRQPTIDLVQRVVLAGDVIGFYAAAVVWPVGLCIDYGLTPTVMLARETAIPVAVAVWVLVAIGMLCPLIPEQRFAILATLAPLAPVLGFVPFLYQDISTVADRYMYMAMLGPALGLAAFLTHRSAAVLRWLTVVALVVAAGLSVRQAATWRDSLILNLEATRLNGGTLTTLNNLGMVLLDADRPADAADCFRRAVGLDAGSVPAHLNLALALQRSEQPEEAEAAYREALRRQPGYAKAHNNLGILLAQQGRLEEARDSFRAALDADPALSDARRNLDQAARLLEREDPPR